MPSTAMPPKHPFDQKVNEVKPSKTDINNLIMDYLITEGYPSAARKFALEANIQPKTGLETVEERVEIRESIHRGDLQTAIEKINELNPQLLDTDTSLHFSLLRLQLIELIRTASTSPTSPTSPSQSTSTPTLTPSISTALNFATTHLAPLAPTNPSFLADLERTMALLIFPTEQLAPELAPLLHPSLRREVANRVNEAILHSQGARREAKIRNLVRLRVWGEKKAREMRREIPEEGSAGLDLGLKLDGEEDEGPGKDTANGHENGSGNGGAMEGLASEAAGGVALPVMMET
ncbi:MAG: hypothetical protein Q9160_006722 [Pyrenula sp. 1 TL-2023]